MPCRGRRLLWLLAVVFPLPAQTGDGRALYLLAATPAPKAGASFPATLYRLSPRNEIAAIREIASADEGVNSVEINLEDRMISIAAHSKASEFFLVRMDNPERPEKVTFPGVGSDAYLLDLPEHRLLQSMLIDGRVTGIDLTAGADRKPIDLPRTDYRFLTFAGSPGRVESAIPPPLGGLAPGGRILSYGQPAAPLGLALPEVFGGGAGDRIVYHVINREVIALSIQAGRRVPDTELLIYNKGQEVWSKLAAPGDSPRIGGFGPWITAMAGERIGSGRLIVYHSETQRRYEIDTGQGDGEILLISGQTAWYRVDDHLYSAELTPGGIRNTKLLIVDDAISNVHWAFLPR